MVKDKNVEQFNFSKINIDKMENEIMKLNVKKATTYKNIPSKILKQNVDICTPILTY